MLYFNMQSLPNSIEQWKPVVGYEGWYEVSDRGRIKRVKAAMGATVGRIIGYRCNSSGYPYVVLSKKHEKRTFTVHCIVAAAFLGPRPAGYEVNHKNGRKEAFCLSNLEYVTVRENIDHALRLGLWARGERAARAKLTTERVCEIRVLQGVASSYQVAKRFDVSSSTINRIWSRRAWKHLP